MLAKSTAAKAILVFSFDFKKAETEAKTAIAYYRGLKKSFIITIYGSATLLLISITSSVGLKISLVELLTIVWSF